MNTVIGVIRGRNQVTIPDSIRKKVSWIGPNTVITFTTQGDDAIVIKPHKKTYDWDALWKQIKKSRSYTGKGTMSAAEFLERDRNSH